MIDLNDLRLFERVAALRSFSAASRALDVPKSSVSRSIQRLENDLGVRLLQRTTRDVALTDAGAALLKRSGDPLARIGDALHHVGSLGDDPRGTLTISAGIGFGLDVLSRLVPAFSREYPAVAIVLNLASSVADLVGERVDVAIRMGTLPASDIVARPLGNLERRLCASPDYLARRGTPHVIKDLRAHELVDLPVRDGSTSTWRFSRDGETVEHRQDARLTVNCALTIHRMLLEGAGIGMSSGHLCEPEMAKGRLIHLLPQWTLPPVPVNAVFPSGRQMAPAVRAFIDFLVHRSRVGFWRGEGLDPC